MDLLAQTEPLNLDTIENEALPGFKFAGGSIGDIVSALIPYIFFGAGVALLAYIILGGYTMMTSRGDAKALAAGKDKVTHGLIGFVIVFTAFWIVQLIGRILGLTDITNIFGGGGNPPPVFCLPGQICPQP